MDLQAIITVSGGAVALAGALLAIIRLLRRLVKQNEEFHLDWYGEPARPGRGAVPGVPERLSRIEKELRPNGGGSLRDAVNRLESRLEEHLRSHGGAT